MSDDYSPQLEKGYTRISNEWDRELTRASYPGRVKDVIRAVVRYTWGYNATWRAIPIEDIMDYVGVGERRAYELRDEALRHNLIRMEGVDRGTAPPRYCVQKMYLDWIEYRASSKSRKKAALKYRPQSERKNRTEGTPSEASEGPPSEDAEGTPSEPPIYKDNTKTNQDSTRIVTDRERRLQKRQALLNDRLELLTGLPQAVCELLEGWIENCAAANGTGTITLSREVSELRALLGLREEVGVDAWAYGIFQANAKRATAINYIKKAAGSYRPGSSNGGLPADSPLLKMRGPARAEAFERTKPLEPPRN